MKNLVFVFLLAVVFTFCKNKKTESTSNETTTETNTTQKPEVVPLSFVQDSLHLKSELCKNKNESECAEVSIKYLKATGGDASIAAIINKRILEILGKTIDYPGDTPKNKTTIELIAKSFIVDYDRMAAGEEDKSFIPHFNNETEIQVIYNSPKSTCLAVSNYSFTGGAHGNFFTTYYNFNKESGELIKASEILKDKEKLSPLLEKQVRKYHRIEADKDLKDFGFIYEGDKFPVNDNIGLLKDSLVFMYNPYEVGPYVMGDMSLKIAKNEIKDHLILK